MVGIEVFLLFDQGTSLVIRKLIMESLSKKFSLLEHEGNQYLVQEVEIEGGNFLATRFFASRVLNMESITRTFKLLWRTRKGFEVRYMGNHRIFFRVQGFVEFGTSFEGRALVFYKNLVAFKRVSKNTDVRNLVFDRISFGCKCIICLLVVSPWL